MKNDVNRMSLFGNSYLSGGVTLVDGRDELRRNDRGRGQAGKRSISRNQAASLVRCSFHRNVTK
jgi:hypothetical protein